MQQETPVPTVQLLKSLVLDTKRNYPCQKAVLSVTDSFDPNPIRILIVDDHPVVRSGMKSLLAEYDDVQVVAEAENSAEALQQMSQSKPDVCLIDIRLSEENGLTLARRALRQFPRQRIVIITSYDDEELLLEAAKTGVDGYLLKSSSSQLLVDTIRAVYKGEKRLSPDMGDKAFSSIQDLSRELATLRLGITESDVKILSLVAEGHQVVEIARLMHMSERTLKRRIQDILTKLSVKTRAQAVAEAYERGIL